MKQPHRPTLKLSTPCILAVSHFCLFHLNAHKLLNTYIYHQLPPKHFVVCYTIFRHTIVLLVKKRCAFCNVAIKCTIYPFLIYSAVPMFKTICISSSSIWKILKMSVKILNCSTLISVGSCYLLCMFAYHFRGTA